MTEFGIEVRIKLPGSQYAWQRIGPINGAPYVYRTRAEAEYALRLCYDADPTTARVVKVES